MRLREKAMTAHLTRKITCSRPATCIENSKLWSVIPVAGMKNERALLDELAEAERLVVPRYPDTEVKVAELYLL